MSHPDQPEIEEPGAPVEADSSRTEELTRLLERSRTEIANSVRQIRDELAAIDGKEAATRAREWAQRNPLLATGIALGAGVLLGSAVGRLFSPPPPPTISERARRRLERLAGTTSGFVGEIGSGIGSATEDVRRRANDVGARIADRASDFTSDVVRQATDLAHAVVQTSAAAKADLTDRMGAAAASLPVDETTELVNSLGTTVRTALVATVARKLSDFVSRIKKA